MDLPLHYRHRTRRDFVRRLREPVKKETLMSLIETRGYQFFPMLAASRVEMLSG
jgi:hypothetical protein